MNITEQMRKIPKPTPVALVTHRGLNRAERRRLRGASPEAVRKYGKDAGADIYAENIPATVESLEAARVREGL